MRLFTAIDLSAEVRANIDRLLARLRQTASIHWSPASNLHVTTKFIGNWPPDRLGELSSTLGGIPLPPPFAMELRGLGWFPNPHSPRVLWVGVKAPPQLAALVSGTEEALAALGVPKEDRPFSPHLTLARVKAPTNLLPLKQAIAALDSDEFGVFTASSFHLYESRPGQGGSVYIPMEEFAFPA